MKKQILDDGEIDGILSRIAREILQRNVNPSSLIFVGLKQRGDVLAERIASLIESANGSSVPLSAIDITFYRDDVNLKAYKGITQGEIPFDLTDKNVILVDDVIFTGRSIRAAMNVLMDSGRPKSIQLAVLIDRGSRELPIQPDYVGKKIRVDPSRHVVVQLKESDGINAAFLSET
jgi:pyrimidine operon attenuation protein/uracil phosphoribosyltransferase